VGPSDLLPTPGGSTIVEVDRALNIFACKIYKVCKNTTRYQSYRAPYKGALQHLIQLTQGSKASLVSGAYWLIVFPGLLITLTILALAPITLAMDRNLKVIE
jgi:hypothetical protein